MGHRVMTGLVLMFLLSLLPGQLTGFPLASGVTIYLHDIVLVVLLVTTGVRLLLVKQVVRPRLIRPIMGFAAVAALSLVVNFQSVSGVELFQSSLYAVRWILYALVYVVVVQQVVSPVVWLWGLYAVGAGFAILGLLQYLLYPALQNLSYLGWDPHYYRVFSTLFDPNFTGILLVFTLLWGTALLATQKRDRWLLSVSQIVILIALLLTYSRSSFVAFITAGLVWMIVRRQWRVGVIGIIAFLFLILALPQHGMDVLRLFRWNSTVARIGNWQEGMALISKAPIFGHGFNTLRYTQGTSFMGNTTEVLSRAGAGMDSSILFLLATTGVAGLAAYGYLAWCMVGSAIALRRQKKQAVFAEAYLLSLIALAVHSLFVNSAFYPWVMLWMWMATGVIEARS